MRLIDADALIDFFEQWKAETKGRAEFLTYSIVDNTECAIRDAPTIEAVPISRERWIVTEAWPHMVYCSNCHKTYGQKAWAVWYDGTLPRRYCPACGALMEEE